jgi:DNA-directed RNA polymerase subunit RPC12/RpoP
MIFINVIASLLSAVCNWDLPMTDHYNLKYFCVQCGSELSINEQTSRSQGCLRCGYTLLHGMVKKQLMAKKLSEVV